ncbi:U11/U12 small nuclear ribonucleoprotein 48 kDa protein-like [Amphiura filiformis]|uniref:U11/U12 small nuclear ribonucleoprotein 48 kDa protein-like n=1 Tax=Amphiura filiformis TaxID=82378 RepID=UPI003B20E18C
MMMPTSNGESGHSRQAFIDSLSALIDKGKTDAEVILNKLQWSKETVLEGADMVRCPVNSHHLVPEAALSKHSEECQLVKEGYSRQEQKEIPHNDWYYENAKNVTSILIDQSTQNQILSKVSGSSGIKPVVRTMDRIETDLNSQEKLAIYEYVVQKAKEAGHGSNVSLEDLAFDPTSFQKGKRDAESRAAAFAKQRDLKRRRQTYRAKNVHITRRSQTQIMKEIIDSQMSELEDIYQDERRRKRKEEKRKEISDDRDGRRNERDRRREDREDDRRDERRRRRRRRYSDDSGDEDASAYDRVRVKIEDEAEEGEVVEGTNSRKRSRHSSRDRSPRGESRHRRRERERSPSIAKYSRSKHDDREDVTPESVNDDKEGGSAQRSREESVESFAQIRLSSREGSVDSSRRDEEEKRHRKKKKSDREHRSKHKHKRSHDRVRVKEEK